jgi:tRNA threonylcarbamoyladenosine biosynthesis protein TsaB
MTILCACARGSGGVSSPAMASLRQLLAAHSPLLLMDAASSRVQVGWLRSVSDHAWHASGEEAGVGVFECAAALDVPVTDAGAFLFCDGPGSVLGIRTVAMALRTWRLLRPRPVFAYTSLAVVAHTLRRPEVGVIADARRDSWHLYQIGLGLRRVAAAQLRELCRELVMPDGFRHWSPLPENVARVPYSLRELLPQVVDADLFLETEAPDAFLHEEPSYVTWTPQIHRAPGER